MKKKSNPFGVAGFVISLCSVALMAVPVLPGVVATLPAGHHTRREAESGDRACNRRFGHRCVFCAGWICANRSL